MKMRAFRPVLFAATLSGLAALMLVPLALGQGKPAAKPVRGEEKIQPASTPEAAPATLGKPVDLKNGNFNGVNFHTNVGSFKLLGSDPNLVQGKLDFGFKGTVLISDLEEGSKVSVSGDVRKEYTTDDKSKILYFGNGKISILGRFRAVQFFGQNLKGRFFGWGVFRFYGEFDKNLDTGSYQLDGGQLMPFGTGGATITIEGNGASGGEVKVKKVGG